MSLYMAFLAETKKQIEYYLGDMNLAKDEFFREKIQGNPDGYLDFTYILQCNKVKKMELTVEKIREAIKDSEVLEVSKDG